MAAAPSRMERLQAMLVEEPNDPELHYMLAMEHVSVGDDAGAVRCFEELLRRTAEHVPAYHQCGRALVRLGNVSSARTLLQQGLTVARQRGNDHAYSEMQGLLESLE